MRRVVLILVLVAVAVFCALNYHAVRVWPFAALVPLFLVILISFALGLAAGWLGRSLNARRAARAARQTTPAED